MPDLVSAHERVTDALVRLDRLLDPSPVDPAPVDRCPEGDAPAEVPVGWTPVSRLADPDVAERLARAYSDDLRTPHLAVGAACGLQHYTGRLATTVLGVWAQTGVAMELRPTRWSAELDARGHTLRVGTDRPAVEVEDATLADVLAGLRTHAEPLVAAACTVGRITPRLAWGSLATSCAGALARLERLLPDDAVAGWHRQAHDALGDAAWAGPRPTISLRSGDGPYGPRLVHERHTCCLIRLGEGHGTCGTCPRSTAPERRAAMRRSAALPPSAVRLPVGPPR